MSDACKVCRKKETIFLLSKIRLQQEKTIKLEKRRSKQVSSACPVFQILNWREVNDLKAKLEEQKRKNAVLMFYERLTSTHVLDVKPQDSPLSVSIDDEDQEEYVCLYESSILNESRLLCPRHHLPADA